MFPVTTTPPTLGLEQVKCDQYWPGRGTDTYGMIQVTVLDTVELATYTIRTFALYKVNTSARKRKSHLRKQENEVKTG